MSAEQIAEVIRAHQPTTGMSVASGVTCRCGYWNGEERAGINRPAGYQGLQWHQAQELSAAGFGLVADAKAEAALEAAQDIVTGLAESCPDATLAIGFVEGYRDACEDAIREPVVSRSVRDPDYRQEKPAPNPYEDEEGRALVQAIHDRKKDQA